MCPFLNSAEIAKLLDTKDIAREYSVGLKVRTLENSSAMYTEIIPRTLEADTTPSTLCDSVLVKRPDLSVSETVLTTTFNFSAGPVSVFTTKDSYGRTSFAEGYFGSTRIF